MANATLTESTSVTFFNDEEEFNLQQACSNWDANQIPEEELQLLSAPTVHKRLNVKPLVSRELHHLVDERDLDKFHTIGIDQIAASLCTDLHHGLLLSPVEMVERKKIYGSNETPTPPKPSIIHLWFDHQKRANNMFVLLVGILYCISSFLIPSVLWYEGLMVIAVILGYTFLLGAFDYRFTAGDESPMETVYLLRNGEYTTMPHTGLLVGDILICDSSTPLIPADGLIIETDHIQVEESIISGTPVRVCKSTDKDPFVFAKSRVLSGKAKILVTAVGTRTRWFRLKNKLALRNGEEKSNPAIEKLAANRILIAKTVGAAAIFVVIILSITEMLNVFRTNSWDLLETLRNFVGFCIYASSIMVLVLPLGYPDFILVLRTMRRMIADYGILWKSEGPILMMGSVTTVCMDAVGSLTKNQPNVMYLWLAGSSYNTKNFPSPKTLHNSILSLIEKAVSYTTTATLEDISFGRGEFEVHGDETEGALLIYVQTSLGINFSQVRFAAMENNSLKKVYEYSATRRRSAIAETSQGRLNQVYCMGPAEELLSVCVTYATVRGNTNQLDSEHRAHICAIIKGMEQIGMKAIAIAYRNVIGSPMLWSDRSKIESNLSLIAIFGIKDPIREGMPDIIHTFKQEGVLVKLITSESLETVIPLAKQSHILNINGVSMNYSDYEALSTDEQLEILPHVQVLANADPMAKQYVLNQLQNEGESVAFISGHDVVALKQAHIGITFGYGVKPIVKDYCDLILIDNDTGNILRCMYWGKSILNSLRKFALYKATAVLTATSTLLIIAIYACIVAIQTVDNKTISTVSAPFNITEMVFVNVCVVGICGAVALDNNRLQEQKPFSMKREAIYTPVMYIHLIVQLVYQTGCLVMLCFVHNVSLQHNTFLFLSFMFMQLFNLLNCRAINNEIHILWGLTKDWAFMICETTLLAITIAGVLLFGVHQDLSWKQWVISFGVGLSTIIVSFVTRIISRTIEAKFPNIFAEQ